MSDCSFSQESHTEHLPLPLLRRKLLNLMLQKLYLQEIRGKKSLPNLFTIIFNIWRIGVKNYKEMSKQATDHAFSRIAMLHMQSTLSQLP